MVRLGERGEKTFWAESGGDFFWGSFVGVVEDPDGCAILKWRRSERYIHCSTTVTLFQSHIIVFSLTYYSSWLGMAQIQSILDILDQKWPNIAGFFTFQSGPKGTKMANPGVLHETLLGPYGPFWIISDKNEFFASNGQSRVWRRCFKHH